MEKVRTEQGGKECRGFQGKLTQITVKRAEFSTGKSSVEKDEGKIDEKGNNNELEPHANNAENLSIVKQNRQNNSLSLIRQTMVDETSGTGGVITNRGNLGDSQNWQSSSPHP